MRYTDIDRRIEALADRQHGAFTRQQSYELGASERFAQRRLAQKVWCRPVPAVFVLARSRGTWKRQCKIAELSVDGAAIAGRSALALHERPGFRPGHIELVVPVNSFCGHPFATLHRHAGAKLTVVDGIRVSTIPQSLFDVASRTSPWLLERAMDDALLGGTTTFADLSLPGDSFGCRNGTVQRSGSGAGQPSRRVPRNLGGQRLKTSSGRRESRMCHSRRPDCPSRH